MSITISNIAYDIMTERTADDCEATGHNNTARSMRAHKIARALTLVRPNGKKMFATVQYENGNFSKLQFVGSV